MSRIEAVVNDLACWVLAAIFLLGLLVLGVELYRVQVKDAANFGYASSRQSLRRLQTSGPRGLIFDRHGELLAGNRVAPSIVCLPSAFQRRSWEATVREIETAIAAVSNVIGRASPLTQKAIRRHVNQSLALPLVVWRDVDHETLARFLEHEVDFPGFSCRDSVERVYPQGSLAAHLLGYVGRDRGEVEAGDEKFNFFSLELQGRAGLESYYDSYLRGVPGEKKLQVDARGFTISEWTVTEARKGPDLKLTLDVRLQRTAERQLVGLKGACAALDPRTGEVLAFASAPTFNPNDFVPILRPELYARFAQDPAKPLLNRVSGGLYAPGSTFKPIVALAGLSLGVPPDHPYLCTGVFGFGVYTLHCASRWGHGEVDMTHALMKSCNPYFCNLGMDIGTNAIRQAATALGLGAKTGLDLGIDLAGVVPDADWKMRTYHESWYASDLVQMSIGQGMLLVSPLQMARVAGAIGTGSLVTPHFNRELPVERRPLPFSSDDLAVVRQGMYMVVNGDGESRGSGSRAGLGLDVIVCGKTGTAEVGAGAHRRKNAWFIAYAPAEKPTIAIALVVENGDSGGTTAAPKVNEILKTYFER